MGETLYRRPEILFRWGRLCFDAESPGGGRFHISQGETLFRGRLYFVTPAHGFSLYRAATLTPIGMRSPEPDLPPHRVDVINGWSICCKLVTTAFPLRCCRL